MLRELIIEYGLPLVFANVLLECLGLPLPALPTLVLTGAIAVSASFASASGSGLATSFPSAVWEALAAIVATASIAALIGDALWFWLGRRYGSRVLAFMCKLSISRDTCVNRSLDFFGRFGVRILAVSKFIPGLSTLAIPVAGATGIGIGSFLLYDALGALLWSGIGVAFGAMFADLVDSVLAWLDLFGRGVIAIAVIALALYLAVRWWQRVSLLRRLRMARIDIAMLRTLLEGEPPPLVIDVRRRERRAMDPFAIPGALLLHDDAASQLAGISRDRKLVTYCDCPSEVSAALAAKELTAHGFTDVAPLLGGLEAWRAAGYALEPLMIEDAANGMAPAIAKSSSA
ncbi:MULTISPECIES: VTT domain-containing protein [Caballeronia]|jgi:membrane protein DedA with SNARE-associated domain/rhodanese-related sulfurtransferase|uniref:Membrane protein n=1 Tax=Caballeronia zhejiangensis TaxID=871203 RepID=A0A656QLN4_9BURK|nr:MULTISPECIES: VTT domain-containing protein [Caballeronia]EKS69194.1 rhodanese domain-containing protein [Burkholderia sp. SJ98]KDR29217.1 membrane protein [Caballeronia zhejiangensis]MCG7399776.1 VTT domain-containing protein [Caballeronia zhejiangensis]MDR5763736.1 VTT domain-containing protein [Caballeronia sp. LZ028]